MNETLEATPSTRRFMADMALAGAPVAIDGDRLTYEVLAVSGALAGRSVKTAVSVSEVQGWPLAPPHWIHLEDNVAFAATNTDLTDCPPGWRRHSREFAFAGTSVPPATAWISHVRGFIGLAMQEAA